MVRHPWMKGMLFVMIAASSGVGCASSEPRFREGVAGEVEAAGEASSQHCFCAPASDTVLRIDSSNCTRNATVTSVFYKPSRNGWESITDSSPGEVVVHTEFRSDITRRNKKMFVKARIADLAVVHLQKPLENATQDGRIRSEEVLLHEETTVAGFGATSAGALPRGERRVGQNKVAMLRAIDTQGAREIRFLFPGAHTHQGDSGGPCFQEKEGTRWLVGINGGYVNSETAPESWFTSTSSYRDWIEKQVAEARKL